VAESNGGLLELTGVEAKLQQILNAMAEPDRTETVTQIAKLLDEESAYRRR